VKQVMASVHIYQSNGSLVIEDKNSFGRTPKKNRERLKESGKKHAFPSSLFPFSISAFNK